MKKSKLISLLSVLDKKELKSFALFTQSPYFNKDEDLIKLNDCLIKCAPDFSEEKLKKEVVFKAIFGEIAFDEKKLGYLMSGLTKLVEKFFQIHLFEAEKFHKPQYSLKALLNHKKLNFFEREYQKVEHELNEIEKKDQNYFLDRFQISELSLEHFNMLQIRKHNNALQIASDNLDKFYLSAKLKYLCSMMNDQKMLSAKYDMTLMNELTDFISKNPEKTEPNIHLYYLLFNVLAEEENQESFESLKQFLTLNLDYFSLSDAKFVYSGAINYCIRKLKKGERQFAEEALYLYTEAIEKEILFENGILSHQIYKNVVDLALGLKQYDSIEEFIHSYKDKLDVKFRENALYYNLANLFWHRKDYSEAMSLLNQIQFSDIYYSFGARVMLIKIYYELKEFDPLTSQLAAFSLYLKRNKSVSKTIKESYLNFCGFMNKILRLKPYKKEELLEQIKSSKLLTERSWLLQKTTEWD